MFMFIIMFNTSITVITIIATIRTQRLVAQRFAQQNAGPGQAEVLLLFLLLLLILLLLVLYAFDTNTNMRASRPTRSAPASSSTG